MNSNSYTLKIVTLENAFESIETLRAASCFIDMMRTRALGFRSAYPKSFLPVDRVDFFSRHHLFYIRNHNEWVPFGCYKTVSMSSCEFYGHEFPLLTFMKSIDAREHLESIESTISEAKQSNRDILYGGGLTLTPQFRKINTTSTKMQEIIAALVFQDCIDYGDPIYMTAAANRFRVNELFEKIGFEPLKNNQVALPPVPIVSAANEPTTLMRAAKLKK